VSVVYVILSHFTTSFLAALLTMSPSFIATYHALDPSASQLRPGTPPAVTRDLLPAVTINAPAQGNFGGPDAVERNKIFKLDGIEPDFLQEFRSKLRQPRWIEPDLVCFFKSHTTLVIEFRHRTHRTLRILNVNFPDSTTTFKTHPRASGKVTASPANIYCIILQARF
jgi:hypothetical protein